MYQTKLCTATPIGICIHSLDDVVVVARRLHRIFIIISAPFQKRFQVRWRFNVTVAFVRSSTVTRQLIRISMSSWNDYCNYLFERTGLQVPADCIKYRWASKGIERAYTE